jgi:myo-inositol-1(or 4)-monophosphatase
MSVRVGEDKVSLSEERLFALRDVAVHAARRAANILKKSYHTSIQILESSSDDIKIDLDFKCEDIIIKTLRAYFPEHGIISEEGGTYTGESEYCWIIDPLDGTFNYFNGIPYFCTSVGCYFNPDGNHIEDLNNLKPVIGVIHAPLLDELYVGVHGKGALLNNQALCIKSIESLEKAILSLSLSRKKEEEQDLCTLLDNFLHKVRKIRTFGSTALGLCYVAAGRLGAHIQHNARIWDFAAARVILEEAGSIFQGEKNADDTWYILGVNPHLKSQIETLIPKFQ